MVDLRRIRWRNDKEVGDGPVVYWMQRDHRVRDNYALLYAQEQALLQKVPLVVVFNLVEAFLGASSRHFDFMLHGLREVENNLTELRIPFVLLRGDPKVTLPAFIEARMCGLLVTDFSPLKISNVWKHDVAGKISVAFAEVDAHNVVPCWTASSKEEFAAHTFRPKLRTLYAEFKAPAGKVKEHPFVLTPQPTKNIWPVELESMSGPVLGVLPGEREAQKMLRRFVQKKLGNYETGRNNPNVDGQSNLSPYLHFGHISAARIAVEVERAHVSALCKRAFLEELIVRRELSDNFCFYQANYDSFLGLRDWAKRTLDEHRNDVREYVYTYDVFKEAKTHDELWNAAQLQLAMHFPLPN